MPTSYNLSTISQLLVTRRQTLCVAESCTGGLVGAACTALAGSSTWFNGGAIVYQNFLKEQLLGVSSEVLKIQGAVSEECVIQMGLGANQLFETNWSIAGSGIAGPGGSSKDNPVGLVYIGVCGPKYHRVSENFFTGDRQEVRLQAVSKSFEMLVKALQTPS